MGDPLSVYNILLCNFVYYLKEGIRTGILCICDVMLWYVLADTQSINLKRETAAKLKTPMELNIYLGKDSECYYMKTT